MITSTSLALQKATSQNHTQKSLYPYLFLSWSHPQVSIFSGRYTCGFQSRHPLAAALSFRIWGVLSSVSMQWFRETCAVLPWVMVESREAHNPRVWLLHTSFRQAEVCNSAFSVTVQLQASPTNLFLVRQVPSAPSALRRYSLV